MRRPDDVVRLVSELAELKAFLSRYKVTAWVAQVDRMLNAADDGPDALKTAVLRMFGGMGSINDLIISRVNGHEVDDESAVNVELTHRVKEIWVRAKRL